MSDEITVGIWTVSKGKGNRHYIKCNDVGESCEGLMHPEQLAGLNGCGAYGFEILQDLALAILKFEESQFTDNSIMGKFNR